MPEQWFGEVKGQAGDCKQRCLCCWAAGLGCWAVVGCGGLLLLLGCWATVMPACLLFLRVRRGRDTPAFILGTRKRPFVRAPLGHLTLRFLNLLVLALVSLKPWLAPLSSWTLTRFPSSALSHPFSGSEVSLLKYTAIYIHPRVHGELGPPNMPEALTRLVVWGGGLQPHGLMGSSRLGGAHNRTGTHFKPWIRQKGLPMAHPQTAQVSTTPFGWSPIEIQAWPRPTQSARDSVESFTSVEGGAEFFEEAVDQGVKRRQGACSSVVLPRVPWSKNLTWRLVAIMDHVGIDSQCKGC